MFGDDVVLFPSHVSFDGEAKRFFRLHEATYGVLRRRRMSGVVLEIIVGHATCWALIDRRVIATSCLASILSSARYTSV